MYKGTSKRFRTDESKSFVEQLGTWAARRESLDQAAARNRQKRSDSQRRPLERERASLRSNFLWASDPVFVRAATQ